MSHTDREIVLAGYNNSECPRDSTPEEIDVYNVGLRVRNIQGELNGKEIYMGFKLNDNSVLCALRSARETEKELQTLKDENESVVSHIEELSSYSFRSYQRIKQKAIEFFREKRKRLASVNAA